MVLELELARFGKKLKLKDFEKNAVLALAKVQIFGMNG